MLQATRKAPYILRYIIFLPLRACLHLVKCFQEAICTHAPHANQSHKTARIVMKQYNALQTFNY